MAPKAIVIPVAVLAVIAVCMFVFICWWFPRAWTRGNAMEREEYDERRRQRELAEETAVSSEDPDVELGGVAGGEPKTGDTVAPQARVNYVPPPVTSY